MYKNKEKQKVYMKKWQMDNYDKVISYNKKWQKNNPNKVKAYCKKYYNTNSEKILIYNKKYQQDHKTEVNEYLRNKYKTDLKFNLNDKISRAIRLSLKGNKAGRHWESIVGYSFNDLKEHLEKTLPRGYTWQQCHIDHIIPISVFNYTSPEHIDFKRCWALSNLRLLPAKENIIKKDTIYKPFQPALQYKISWERVKRIIKSK